MVDEYPVSYTHLDVYKRQVDMVVASLNVANDDNIRSICLTQDITKRKKMEHDLIESERSKSVLLSHIPGMAYRCNYDREWTMQFVSAGCFALTGYAPENLLYNRDLTYNDLIVPEYREPIWEEDVYKRQLSIRAITD